jgi:hypothetical protein
MMSERKPKAPSRNTINPGASNACIFAPILKMPRPVLSPEDGTGIGEQSISDMPEGDAAPTSDEGADALGHEPGSLIGEDTPEDNGGGEHEGDGSNLDHVPEDGVYDFSSLDLPKGMEIDDELAAMAGPRMAEANMSQNQANVVAGVLTDMRKKQIEDWHQTNRDWQNSVKSDREIGGDNLRSSIQASEKFLDEFGTQELRNYLISSGGGNHPEIIRAFARAGQALAEDNPGGKASGGKLDTASILYPDD